jgi:hypothetical protein
VTKPAPATRSVPTGWLAKYLLGSAVVLIVFVGGLISTTHAAGNLADEIRLANLGSCGATRDSSCLADHPATILAVQHGSPSTRAVVHTSVLAVGDAGNECFRSDCRDVVRLRSADGASLHVGQQLTIRVGKGRIIRLQTGTAMLPTFDNPSISAFSTASTLVWTLYLDAFAVAWLTAYLFLTLDVRPWRIAIGSVRRMLNITGILGFLGAAVTLLALAFHGSAILLGLAIGLLLTSLAALAARGHPEVRDPLEFQGQRGWAVPLRRSVARAIIVLVVFPLPLCVAVSLLLLHDSPSLVKPIIAIAIGIVGAAVLLYFTLRSMRKKAIRDLASGASQHPPVR